MLSIVTLGLYYWPASVQVVVHSCEIMWHIAKYNCNQGRIQDLKLGVAQMDWKLGGWGEDGFLYSMNISICLKYVIVYIYSIYIVLKNCTWKNFRGGRAPGAPPSKSALGNDRKICVDAVQSEIMLKIVTGSQKTRNALIRGIWGNALWELRLFIKYNSYGQFITLLSNVHHGYVKHCCLWISLTRGALCVLLTTTIIWYHICAICNVVF